VRARSHRVAVGIDIAATLITSGALAGGGATLRILMLWNLGLVGWLPDLVYALAAGALAYAVTATARAGHWTTALAIALLACAGIGLHSSYQSALAVIALRARQHDAPADPTCRHVSVRDRRRAGAAISSRRRRRCGSAR
jgi:hypothetical protein